MHAIITVTCSRDVNPIKNTCHNYIRDVNLIC
jgi:hypothetical protein